MQYKTLTPKQKKVLDFITTFFQRNEFSPSFEEIANHFKLKSMASVHQYITALTKKGYLEKISFKQRSIKPLKTIVRIPMLGNVWIDESIEYLSSPRSLSVPKNVITQLGLYYGLQIKGDGWIKYGYSDGNFVVIKNQRTAARGAHVLAIMPNGRPAIKKIGKSKSMSQNFEIIGKIVGTLKRRTSGKKKIMTEKARLNLDTILTGDVLEVMASIPDNSVHLAITSPPYNVGISYDSHNDRMKYQEYLNWLENVWRETKRVLVPGGRFALNIAPTGIKDFIPLHHDFVFQFRKLGMKFRTEIIWYKQTMLKRTAWGSFKSPSNPHIIPSWEYILVFSKDKDRLDGDNGNADISRDEFIDFSDGFWEISPETKRNGHPAPFPEELIYRLIKFYSYRGNTVLDMFGGTGTVALVAKKAGRHFIHIDISKQYNDIAANRLENANIQIPLFSSVPNPQS